MGPDFRCHHRNSSHRPGQQLRFCQEINRLLELPNASYEKREGDAAGNLGGGKRRERPALRLAAPGWIGGAGQCRLVRRWPLTSSLSRGSEKNEERRMNRAHTIRTSPAMTMPMSDQRWLHVARLNDRTKTQPRKPAAA